MNAKPSTVAWWSESAQTFVPYAPPFGFLAARFEIVGVGERDGRTWANFKASPGGRPLALLLEDCGMLDRLGDGRWRPNP